MNKMSTVPSSTRHLKILVPAAAAGRIIGKGGTTIEQLQKDAGARVKMSKASEFYPGTTERVCLISGPIAGILKINDFFLENLSSSLIKILVPNSTAGMIIGKGGSYIKEIKEKSGAYVQISQKSHDVTFPERCVTVIGELANIRIACELILSKIVEDVGSGNYLNINYRDTKSQQIQQQQQQQNSILCHQHQSQQLSAQSQQQLQLQSQQQRQSLHLQQQSTLTLTSPATITAAATSLSTSNPSSTISITNTSISNTNTQTISSPINESTTNHSPVSSTTQDPSSSSAQMIYSIKALLQVSGYGEDEVSEITKAMSTLANYGVLGIGLGLL